MTTQTSAWLLRNRRTKIIATLGPATDNAESIAKLIDTGVDVFRLNMSHGDQSGHREVYERVRAAAQAAGRHIAILADLCGPKIRVGILDSGQMTLTEGATVTVTTRDVVGGDGLIPSQYEDLHKDCSVGGRILLADGIMELEVKAVEGQDISCTVVQGGELTNRKGINLPGVDVCAPALTPKDVDDAEFALGLGVDFLAQSFVRRAADVEQLQSIIKAAEHSALVIAKIERPEAVVEIDSILDVADGIMIARGDLGVELPPEEVPIAQDTLVHRARARNRPVIVATQMLESMIENARPTRAEVADVAHTVLSGADAIMLSAETATGAHPLLAVEMMDRVARQSEGSLWRKGAFGSVTLDDDVTPPIPFGDAVARSTAQLSRDLMVRAIAVFTHSGMSAITVSSARPAAPVVSVSASSSTCRLMNLMWGVIPVLVSATDYANPVDASRALVRNLALAADDEFILLVRGFSGAKETNTPSVTLLSV